MSGFNLIYSFIALGMKEFSKYSNFQETVLNELVCRQELLTGGSKL